MGIFSYQVLLLSSLFCHLLPLKSVHLPPNGKIRFQSFFMLMTVPLFFFASSGFKGTFTHFVCRMLFALPTPPFEANDFGRRSSGEHRVHFTLTRRIP
jgi:hypothetical protein